MRDLEGFGAPYDIEQGRKEILLRELFPVRDNANLVFEDYQEHCGDPISLFTILELTEAVQKLKNGSFPGPGGVLPESVKLKII
ncbi:hypothetical protein JTB14_024504 [Gonioctena quinquepunctata]|nr:hypothetical protein JTB14_024504 [Gonioctena quinquepunctata]